MSLQIETQPTAEPVTIDEVAAVLRLAPTAADVTMLTGYIKAARETAERITRRSLVQKGYVYYMDRFPWPGEVIKLPVPPLVSVASVKYLDNTLALQTWDPAEYFVGDKQIPAIIAPIFPNTYPFTACGTGQGVEIHFTAGKSDIEELQNAIRQLAAFYYDHPEVISSDKADELPLGVRSVLRANRIY